MPIKISCATIDVGMIVYNERGIIEHTINSLLEAGFDSFVVLDMESTDGTAEYLQKILGERLKLTSFPRESLLKYGYAEARNTCANFSMREWLLFVDADEVLLSGGIENHHVLVKSEGSNSSLYSIERKNLVRDPRNADGVVVKSVETHNRLYRPTGRMRFRGYIHEEIFVGDTSGYLDGGHTALVFDHYSALKSATDVEEKGQLYSLMLLRAYNQPDVRQGCNPWWFDHHVPTHMAAIKTRADVFAERHNIPSNFYAPNTYVRPEEDGVDLLNSITSVKRQEVTFDLSKLRTLHSVPCERWLGRSSRAFWGEWNHPNEGSRSLTSLIEAAQRFHWNRFVKPGEVVIDIGAHSGDTAIPLALFAFDKLNGQKGHIVAVEPNPAITPVLELNLELNTHLGHFHTLKAAVTPQDALEVELADHGNAQCNGGLLDGDGLSDPLRDKLQKIAGVRYKVVGVSMATLFCNIRRAIGAAPIGFIKLDCEGYDKEIIRPCRDLFATCKPVLFVEWFAWYTPDDDADLFAVIESLDYVPYDPITLKPAVLTTRVSDVLCLHKESAFIREILA